MRAEGGAARRQMSARARARRALALALAALVAAVAVLAWISSTGGSAVGGVIAHDAAVERDAVPALAPETSRQPIAPLDGALDGAGSSPHVEASLRVRVVYSDGTPAPDARLLLHDARAALAEARTNGEGRAVLRCARNAFERELWIAVAGAGLGVHDEPLAPADVFAERNALPAALAEERSAPSAPRELGQEFVLELPHAGRIAGRVTVEGLAPAADLELELHGQEERPATLPERLWVDLVGGSLEDFDPWQTARVVAGDGAFEFRGLPEKASAAIRVPHGYFASTQYGLRREVSAHALAEDLAIDLVPFPLLRGRLVQADDSPVPRARIRFEVVGNETNFSDMRAESDALGRFELRLPPDWKELALEAESREAWVAGAARFADAFALPAPGELGDIVLERADTYRVRVRELGSAVIEGAEVVWGNFYGYGRARTDRDGTAQLFFPHGEVLRIRVRAEGFHDASATVLDETIEVELERATELVVTVRTADGGCLGGTGFGVELVSLGILSERWNRDNRHLRPLTGESLSSGTDGVRRYWAVVDASCEVRVMGIAVGVPLSLRLLDPTGFAVAEASVAETSASMRVELVAEREPRVLSGRALGPTGEPVNQRAWVIVEPTEAFEDGDGWHARSFTDRDGRFRVETCAPRVRLSVQADGCKIFRLESVDPRDSPLELHLEEESQ